MLYFFEWSEHIRLLMTVLILLATVVQTLTIILNYDRRLQNNRCEQMPECVRDLLILFILFAFSLMHGHVMMAYTRTLFVPVQYYLYRIGIVISLFVLTLYICFSERSLRPLLAALPSIVLLPVPSSSRVILISVSFVFLSISDFLDICVLPSYKRCKINLFLQIKYSAINPDQILHG